MAGDHSHGAIHVDFVRRDRPLDCANGGERLNIINRGRFFRLLADGGLTREIDAWMRRLLTVQIFLGQRCSGQEILERFPIEREMGVHARSPVIPQLRSVGGFASQPVILFCEVNKYARNMHPDIAGIPGPQQNQVPEVREIAGD